MPPQGARGYVARLFVAIVFLQPTRAICQRLDELTAADAGLQPSQFLHQRIDILQLVQCRPATILTLPSLPRLEPHGKGLREIFGGMDLRIPRIQMMDEAT